ncbi:hypothetical protein Pcinc_002870 [Petrolisthes cinctipes]|uniref:GH18 domain-containing protein n=1 Tax=Petrolisthes cinctipes TaxID=88211 RepID=A0AAE1GKH2_PETCI|nr:hypothetical protein Pcinc_002870 [Petrolisthes cinctipes]
MIGTESRQTSQKVVTCYYSNWAYWRSGNGKYTVDDIDVSVCTHLVYAFAVLDANTHKMVAQDTRLDLPSGLDNFRKFTNLKQQKSGLKTLVGLGGWTDSRGSYKYSDLVASPTLRAAFITHAIDFLQECGFDGLDLDWEYPAYYDGGRQADKQNFATFVKELKEALGPRNLLLTSAVPAAKQVIDVGYDIPKLALYLDYIHLMTYDFHGSWENHADHHSPLHKRDFDTTDLYAEFTASYWVAKGAPANKLVLGIPLYGRTYTLSSGQTAPPAPASGPGNAGTITQAAGFLSYMEICTALSNGYTEVKDFTGKMGPYAYKQSQWVGYDDPEMVARKAEFIWQHGLAGGMVWALDLDDFKNMCGNGKCVSGIQCK